MPLSVPDENITYTIKFANLQGFAIYPINQESIEVIEKLAEIMDLSTGKGKSAIYVSITDSKRNPPPLTNSEFPLTCYLPRKLNDALGVIQLSDLAQFIAFQTMPEGGILIHGALIAKDNMGVILAAPGGTGKTTASGRVEASWCQLSDDATLVVKGKDGEYYAHPWPTWSRFYDNGPGGRWKVEESVRLGGIFLLVQAPENKVVPIEKGAAFSCLMEAAHQVLSPNGRNLRDFQETKEICEIEMNTISSLLEKIPAHMLQISLTGPFWEEIEMVLTNEETETDSPIHHEPVNESEPSDTSFFDDASIPIAYSGPSMNPTLSEPDLLQVIPYSGTNPRVGDVICFSSPEKETNVVHRIIRITPGGIVTRGDNNPEIDPYIVQKEDIIGNVVSAWRNEGKRKIYGGSAGHLVHHFRIMQRTALTHWWRFLQAAKPLTVLYKKGVFLVSGGTKPRIVLFENRKNKTCKLFYKDRYIGKYQQHNKTWIIAFPYKLFIDRDQIPRIVKPLNKFMKKRQEQLKRESADHINNKTS